MRRILRGISRGCALAVALVAAACGDPATDVDAPPAPETGVAPAAAPDAPVAAAGLAEVAPGSRRLRLVAVGDISFGRYHMSRVRRRVPTVAEPFADVAPVLRAADIALGNLETPMGTEPRALGLTPTRPGRPPEDPGFSLNFRADPADAALLAAAGFTHLSSANNHILDMGGDVALATRDHLAAAGLVGLGCAPTYAEATQPAVITANGVRVAILARTVWNKGHPAEGPGWGVAYLHNRELHDDLAAEIARVKAATRADFLVLFIHWGWEYEPAPRDAQRSAARALVAAGADVIVGHHSHVVQGFERIGDAVIAYSVGNFLFDQPLLTTRRSVILDVVLDGDRGQVTEARLHPVLIDEDTRTPRLARGGHYRSWASELRLMTRGLDIAPAPLERRAKRGAEGEPAVGRRITAAAARPKAVRRAPAARGSAARRR